MRYAIKHKEATMYLSGNEGIEFLFTCSVYSCEAYTDWNAADEKCGLINRVYYTEIFEVVEIPLAR